MTDVATDELDSSEESLDEALRRIARTERLLVASDFDGTLAPFANDPMDARMLLASHEAVQALLQLPDTAVAFVSGRSLVDLEVISEHTEDSPILLAGSHGAEFWFPGDGAIEPDETSDEVARRDGLRRRAEELIDGLAGVWIEPKTFGFGVHTRRADRDVAEVARQRVDDLVCAEAPDWRRRTGHDIVEYAFRREGKDTAVAVLRAHTGATAVLFAGDDTTDEDALASLRPEDLGVHIGAPPTAATVRVADIASFAAALSRLAALRAAHLASGRE